VIPLDVGRSTTIGFTRRADRAGRYDTSSATASTAAAVVAKKDSTYDRSVFVPVR
jgi:hypothetical protein